MSKTYQDLILAVHKALNGDWDGSHKIVQDMDLDLARWTHAVYIRLRGTSLIVGTGTLEVACVSMRITKIRKMNYLVLRSILTTYPFQNRST